MDVECPYCGETVPVAVDAGGGSSQRYVEDCPVCCRPMELSIHGDEDGEITVVAFRADD
jgi:endogenous inhibitor of DNA gyrase (YacG/DUF329 family)